MDALHPHKKLSETAVFKTAAKHGSPQWAAGSQLGGPLLPSSKNSAEYLGSTDGCCWLLEPLWWGWSHWKWRSWSQWKPQAADLPEIPTYPTRGKEWERDTSGSGPLSNFTPSSFSLHLGDHCPHSLRPSAPPAKQQEIIRIFLETQGIIILTSVPV